MVLTTTTTTTTATITHEQYLCRNHPTTTITTTATTTTMTANDDDPILLKKHYQRRRRRRRSSILESNSPALVWLYAGADCPNCETVLPAVEEAADKLCSWGVSVAAVDLSKETKLRRDLSIPKGLPMMFKVDTRRGGGGGARMFRMR